MNARVKRVTAGQPHEAVDGDDGWIVVQKLKKQPIFDDDGKFTRWIRRVVVGRANKDLPLHIEAASERTEFHEGITSERATTD